MHFCLVMYFAPGPYLRVISEVEWTKTVDNITIFLKNHWLQIPRVALVQSVHCLISLLVRGLLFTQNPGAEIFKSALLAAVQRVAGTKPAENSRCLAECAVYYSVYESYEGCEVAGLVAPSLVGQQTITHADLCLYCLYPAL